MWQCSEPVNYHGRYMISFYGIRLTNDTPTEILCTILLGVVKYYWGQTVWHLEKIKQLSVFQVRLSSVAADGLNIPPITADYMCQYCSGLIGKHFKTLSQIIAFTPYNIVPHEVLNAWLIIGCLTVLLWHTEIDDMLSYTVSILVLDDNSSWFDSITDRAWTMYQWFSQCYLSRKPQHIDIKAELSLPPSPSILHSPLWTSTPLFDPALQIFPHHLSRCINFQQPPGSQSGHCLGICRDGLCQTYCH